MSPKRRRESTFAMRWQNQKPGRQRDNADSVQHEESPEEKVGQSVGGLPTTEPGSAISPARNNSKAN
jgi:hypothetical protein